MKLKKYYCDEYVLRFSTDIKNFAEPRFFRDPRVLAYLNSWKQGRPLGLAYQTRDPHNSDFHCHALFRLFNKKLVRVELRWIEGISKRTKSTQPPFAEELLAWVNVFLAKNIYEVFVVANYSFPTSQFFLGLNLPWPSMNPFAHRVYGLRQRPSTVIGVTVKETIRRAWKSAIHMEYSDDGKPWALVRATYKQKLIQVGPEKVLPEFDKVLREYVVGR